MVRFAGNAGSETWPFWLDLAVRALLQAPWCLRAYAAHGALLARGAVRHMRRAALPTTHPSCRGGCAPVFQAARLTPVPLLLQSGARASGAWRLSACGKGVPQPCHLMTCLRIYLHACIPAPAAGGRPSRRRRSAGRRGPQAGHAGGLPPPEPPAASAGLP